MRPDGRRRGKNTGRRCKPGGQKRGDGPAVASRQGSLVKNTLKRKPALCGGEGGGWRSRVDLKCDPVVGERVNGLKQRLSDRGRFHLWEAPKPA